MVNPPDLALSASEVAELVATAKWIIGGTFAGIAAVLGFLLRLSYSFGGHVAQLKDIAKDMTEIREHADQVPLLEQRVGQLEDSFKRTRSDIKDLLRRPSSPGFEPGE